MLTSRAEGVPRPRRHAIVHTRWFSRVWVSVVALLQAPTSVVPVNEILIREVVVAEPVDSDAEFLRDPDFDGLVLDVEAVCCSDDDEEESERACDGEL